MDSLSGFFLGFLLAGLIGWISTLFSKSLTTATKARKQMFDAVPKPVLKNIPNANSLKGIDAEPGQSPLQAITDGCTTIIIQLMVQIILLLFLGILFWFFWSSEMPQGIFGGVVFAAIMGFLLQNIRKNWKEILRLQKQISQPFTPNLKFTEPPNQHHVAAAPVFPAFTIVFNGFVEIIWRIVWQLVLFYLVFESLSVTYFYVTENALRFTPIGIFGF